MEGHNVDSRTTSRTFRTTTHDGSRRIVFGLFVGKSPTLFSKNTLEEDRRRTGRDGNGGIRSLSTHHKSVMHKEYRQKYHLEDYEDRIPVWKLIFFIIIGDFKKLEILVLE